jgi:hypothetical protein
MNKEQILKLISEMIEDYRDICDETYRQGAIDALAELKNEIINR